MESFPLPRDVFEPPFDILPDEFEPPDIAPPDDAPEPIEPELVEPEFIEPEFIEPEFFFVFFEVVFFFIEPEDDPDIEPVLDPDILPDFVPLLGVICPLPDCDDWALAAAALAENARMSAAAWMLRFVMVTSAVVVAREATSYT